MIPVNEYFEGKVKSLSMNSAGGKETVGVMQPGEYEFSTGLQEIMTVVSGAMTVQFSGSGEWLLFEKGDSYIVPANSKFKLKIYQDAAYLCQFVG